MDELGPKRRNLTKHALPAVQTRQPQAPRNKERSVDPRQPEKFQIHWFQCQDTGKTKLNAPYRSVSPDAIAPHRVHAAARGELWLSNRDEKKNEQ